MNPITDIERIVITLLVLFLAIGIHEFAHAKVADLAGDMTPRSQGRVTLNLFKHFEFMGTMMILITTFSGFGIGWGKPVYVNPGRMKDPRWDHFLSVAAGPASNILQALIFAGILRLLNLSSFVDSVPNVVWYFFFYAVLINFALAFFNLIPFGFLDGHWLLGLLMPPPQRQAWFAFNSRMGMILLVAIIVMDQIQRGYTGISLMYTIIGLPARFCAEAAIGISIQ